MIFGGASIVKGSLDLAKYLLHRLGQQDLQQNLESIQEEELMLASILKVDQYSKRFSFPAVFTQRSQFHIFGWQSRLNII